MMLCGFEYWILWLSVWNILCTNGESNCRNEHVSSINISTHLQSDVLLPCIFNSSLLGSDLTADIAAVWIYKNITEDSLLEIRLNSGVGFWNTRGGRIIPFPKLSTSGNFSILLQNVNESDWGLYYCELFNGINCRIAYHEIFLNTVAFPHIDHRASALYWSFIAGGGAAVLTLLVVSLCCIRHLCKKASDELIYENTGHHQRSSNKTMCGNTAHNQRKVIELNEKGRSRKPSPPKPGIHDKSPMNCRNDYIKSFKESEDIYVNQPH